VKRHRRLVDEHPPDGFADDRLIVDEQNNAAGRVARPIDTLPVFFSSYSSSSFESASKHVGQMPCVKVASLRAPR
jgi:hypothetical protein